MYSAEAEQHERDQQAVINERNQQVYNQLKQLIEDWRNRANGHYCETYNPGMAQGLNIAANSLEKFCLGLNDDDILRKAGYDPDEIGAQMKAAAEAALARAREEQSCTCADCLDIIKKEIEDEAKL